MKTYPGTPMILVVDPESMSAASFHGSVWFSKNQTWLPFLLFLFGNQICGSQQGFLTHDMLIHTECGAQLQ